MIDDINYEKVYIIESPSRDNFLEDKTEGKALTAVLRLLDIDYEYFVCISQESILEALRRIALDLEIKNEEFKYVHAILHFSAHGTNEGMVLSNDDRIQWSDLGELIEKVNSEAFPGFDLSPIHLVMSCCYGYLAFQSDDPTKTNRFNAVLGCDELLPWDAAIVAFTSYYYNLVARGVGGFDAVECMNKSIQREDFFKVYLSHELEKTQETRQIEQGNFEVDYHTKCESRK